MFSFKKKHASQQEDLIKQHADVAQAEPLPESCELLQECEFAEVFGAGRPMDGAL